jgi:2Fe-2S ferredoxin
MRVSRQSDISITVFIRGEKHSIATYPGEYRNLMMLLYDKFSLDDFGECKGTGRCGTCHIQVSGDYSGVLNRVGNENATLSKMTGVTDRSRLACQMNIDEKLDGLFIEIIAADEL